MFDDIFNTDFFGGLDDKTKKSIDVMFGLGGCAGCGTKDGGELRPWPPDAKYPTFCASCRLKKATGG